MHNILSQRGPIQKHSLLRDERGLSTVEYVILMAVVVVGAVATWNTIGGNFKTKLGEASTDVANIGK